MLFFHMKIYINLHGILHIIVVAMLDDLQSGSISTEYSIDIFNRFQLLQYTFDLEMGQLYRVERIQGVETSDLQDMSYRMWWLCSTLSLHGINFLHTE